MARPAGFFCSALFGIVLSAIGASPAARAQGGDGMVGRAEILAVVEKVADYQITAMAAGLSPARNGEGYPNPKGWVQAALFVGLTELADRSSQPRYKQLILQRGEANQWKLCLLYTSPSPRD